ncbi:hypothetical protein IW261DRAFT_1433740 [Armillaria novae-zelandiae]|uniref:DUF6534 domain-containing protein n=1 Tax=Armillaria novae-zelandiae TaxID=153914 RepID=A0AA39PUC7_9AGAR|nr:hypothetical protein IW261DRAFT_1433740 [Armillaria novae-zelandiae]
MLASSPTIEYPFWGFILSILLFGVLLVQTWRYYRAYDKDRSYLRVFVAVLFILSCASTAMHIAVAHSLLFVAANFQAVNFLDAYSPFMAADYVIIGFLLFLNQLFFVSRIYFLRPDGHWILGALVLFSTGTFAAAVVTFVSNAQSRMISGPVLYGSDMVSDVVITAYYWWIFAQSRSDFRQTKKVLKRLRLYTAGRGLLVTVAQTICFVLHVVQTHQLRW